VRRPLGAIDLDPASSDEAQKTVRAARSRMNGRSPLPVKGQFDDEAPLAAIVPNR
jgi:hypothetical protein